MRKEDVVSATVMTIVSILVLIGFTVAWYSGVFHIATLTGIRMQAAELNSIIIALEPGGEDISVLEKNNIADDEYADIGLQEMTNIETGKLAPGQFGKVTFYITPSNKGIEYCNILPTVWIRQGEKEWYPGEGGAASDDAGENVGLEELYEITQRHIDFFADEEMTQKIDEKNPLQITWSEADGDMEKEVIIYWQWYYEYPFTDEEKEGLDEDGEQLKIDEYDEEDTKIGNNVTAMKFHFTFIAK